MTTHDFIWDKFPNLIKSDLELSRSELSDLLQEFAILKCAEQRVICADNAEQEGDEGDELWIDKDSIVNSPTPEM